MQDMINVLSVDCTRCYIVNNVRSLVFSSPIMETSQEYAKSSCSSSDGSNPALYRSRNPSRGNTMSNTPFQQSQPSRQLLHRSAVATVSNLTCTSDSVANSSSIRQPHVTPGTSVQAGNKTQFTCLQNELAQNFKMNSNHLEQGVQDLSLADQPVYQSRIPRRVENNTTFKHPGRPASGPFADSNSKFESSDRPCNNEDANTFQHSRFLF